MKILTVIGARPQFIKAAVVSRALKTKKIEEIIIHTGQHFDENMSSIFLEQLNIPEPKYMLNINDCSHGAMTGRMIEQVEKIIIDEKPDCVMIYGDTNSTLAGALAASKLHVPIAHVEAGLRSFNMKMPEEVNRILADRISKYLFCSTEAAVTNLNNEGFAKFDAEIHLVGDVMYDTALLFKELAEKPDNIDLESDFFLCTFHRAENTDDSECLSAIVNALNYIHNNFMPVVLPLHPRTKKMIEKFGLSLNVKTIDPVSYLNMVWLLDNAKAVLTDSGGLQKEAYFFKNPCITLREETEWVELVDEGYNYLSGANEEKIINFAERIYSGDIVFQSNEKSLYGDGKASEKIASMLLSGIKE